ncbi:MULTISPECIES: hypothetical protein [unclassified Gordonia (in: high G+C Gram-positive bacteria)]
MDPQRFTALNRHVGMLVEFAAPLQSFGVDDAATVVPAIDADH